MVMNVLVQLIQSQRRLKGDSNGASKTVGSDKRSTSTSRKRDGEEKSRNGRGSVQRGRKRSRSCSPENTEVQPHGSAGGKTGCRQMVMQMVRLSLLPKSSVFPSTGQTGIQPFSPFIPIR